MKDLEKMKLEIEIERVRVESKVLRIEPAAEGMNQRRTIQSDDDGEMVEGAWETDYSLRKAKVNWYDWLVLIFIFFYLRLVWIYIYIYIYIYICIYIYVYIFVFYVVS